MLNLQALSGLTGLNGAGNLSGLPGLYGLRGLGHLSAEPAATDGSAPAPAPPLVDTSKITKDTVIGLLVTASAVVSGYHGIKRNHGSIGWGIAWFVLGGIFPVFTPLVAVARKPGFAKPK